MQPDPRTCLEAGGLVPASTVTDLPTDTVDARVYGHPCLPGRRVVRLVPDALAAGIDAEMALADFALIDHRDDIARQRRRALGFPGAVLVNDPDRAAYAVQVHRELLVHGKRVATKPGHAKEGIDAIAGRLEKEVPSFLPSFWEEAGRIFATGGNLAYAATAFEKARASEREFGLPVDEDRRDEAYVEFALLGALAVKSLQSYAKDLVKSRGAEEGYERFYRLAVRRTLGGLPPWASLAKDLRAGARAAKRDLAAEDERLVLDLIDAPGLGKSSLTFFEEYTSAFARAALREPRVHARLLDLFPTFGERSWRQTDKQPEWLSVLHGTGSLAALLDPASPASALPAGGRAGWLRKAQSWIASTDGSLVQIARAMGPALLADGATVTVASYGWRHPLDLDLVETLRGLGVPVAYAPEAKEDEDEDEVGGHTIDLDDWANREPCPARWGLPELALPTDLTLAVADPTLGPWLIEQVGYATGRANFERAAAGKPAIQQARHQALVEKLTPVAGGLPPLRALYDAISSKLRPATFEEFPDLSPMLDALDVPAALARTLVTGLAAELHWPAFEAARSELGNDDLDVSVSFPYVFVRNAHRILVLGPSGRQFEHDVKLPDGFDIAWTTWAGDDLFVYGTGWQSRVGWRGLGYWARRPNETFDQERTWRLPDYRVQTTLPDGRMFEGGSPVRPGDQFAPAAADIWADPTGVWVEPETASDGLARREPDGTLIPGSRPAFFDDVLTEELRSCAAYVQPYPDSLLGGVDGWYAIKVLPGHHAVTSDGRRTARPIADRLPDALIRWPGDDRLRVLDLETGSADSTILIRHPDDDAVGTAVEVGATAALPLLAWHALTPRDLPGSVALRAVTRDTAVALIAAGKERARVEAVVAELLPEVTAPALRDAVVATVADAILLQRQLLALRSGESIDDDTTDDEDGDEPEVPGVSDATLRSAASGLCDEYGHRHIEAALRSQGAALFARADGPVHETSLSIQDWIGRARGLAIAAVRPVEKPADRAAVRAVLQAWVASGWADGRRLRRAEVEAGPAIPSWAPTFTRWGSTEPRAVFRLDHEGARLIVTTPHWDDDDGGRFVIWEASDGEWHLPPDVRTTAEITEYNPPAERAWIEAFLAATQEDRVWTPTSADAEALAAAIQRSVGEARLLLIGCYSLSGYAADFLGKHLREAIGIKLGDAKVARGALPSMSRTDLLELYAEAMPDDPNLLWTATPTDPQGFVARFAVAWNRKFGARVALPEGIVKASKTTSYATDQLLEILTRPPVAASPAVAPPVYAIDASGDVAATQSGFTADLLAGLPAVVDLVTTHTEADHALRAEVRDLARAARAAYAGDALLPVLEHWHGGSGKDAKACTGWFESLDAEEKLSHANAEDPAEVTRRTKDDGVFVAASSTSNLGIAVRPNRLDPARAAALTKLFAATDQDDEALVAWRWIMRPDVVAWTESLGTGAGNELDPRVSAPDAVARLADAAGVDADAATLLLQTLALRAPQKKSLIAWNGWKPKSYDAAAAALTAAGHLVAAKRAGAGRDVFLPGPWDDQLGSEVWKSPWYDAALGHAPTCAPGRRFELAADRWIAGDRPTFAGGKK